MATKQSAEKTKKPASTKRKVIIVGFIPSGEEEVGFLVLDVKYEVGDDWARGTGGYTQSAWDKALKLGWQPQSIIEDTDQAFKVVMAGLNAVATQQQQ